MLDSGYFFYLYQTRQIKDVRVVYAPPRNIGVFGGDPDNFEWTRHTGDFTFLRAYTAPDGSSAEYSANNIPYKCQEIFDDEYRRAERKRFRFCARISGRHDALSREPVDRICT